MEILRAPISGTPYILVVNDLGGSANQWERVMLVMNSGKESVYFPSVCLIGLMESCI